MTRSISLRLLVAYVLVFAGCGRPQIESTADTGAGEREPSPYLYVWARDTDERDGDTDFLAVLDADPSSPGYGRVISTAPVGVVGTGAHHAEAVAPADATLLANGFRSGRTFRFDLAEPASPRMVGELAPVPGFRSPHDFVRLADGTVLATLQFGDSTIAGDPGALALFDRDARLLSVSSAADPAFPGEILRPYSVELLPEYDRVLTTGRSMAFTREKAADVVQIWRLSDLQLIRTLSVPRLEPAEQPECTLSGGELCVASRYAGEMQPFVIRALKDGTAIMNTFACGFYRITGLEGLDPTIEPVLNWPDLLGCSVPVLVGDLYVMPVMFEQMIVVLDLSDPALPREVHRYRLPGYSPHWMAADPTASRVVATSDGPDLLPVVLMFDLDPGTGALVLDESFGEAGPVVTGVSFDRPDWPHGPTGPAIPHAALFGR